MAGLYHYTTGAGLLGMFKDYSEEEPNIKLWASHYMYMNDPLEFKIGPRICENIIDKIETQLSIAKEYRIKELVNSTQYRDAANQYMRTQRGQSLCPYIISLSRAIDSLNMWSMYALNGNGLALGFNERKLLDSKILTRECIYCDSNSLIVPEKFYNDVRDLYLELESEHPLSEAIRGGNDSLYERCHIIYSLIRGHLGSRIKDKAYNIEKEERIIPVGKTYKILFRERNGLIIPYIEYPVPFDCVDNIIVGPTADFERVRESILIFLDTKGIKWNDDKILKSNVPYRF